MKGRVVLLWLCCLPACAAAFAQGGAPPVAVDAAGVMRWADGDEVALFGVNYTTPFAYAYRAHAAAGVSPEAGIDRDVQHLARLGLDAFRVHVWDREVSDSTGRLLENEHLRLFDYLIARLEERGFTLLLTPIAWWGTGWPEPDVPTPGFAARYTKAQMASDPAARAAQRTYLRQFLDHVNPYTGRAYKDDPAIVAIELFNEPSHPEPPAQTTAYVSELVGVVRATGFDKPVFYNVSQNWSAAHAAAVAAADVQGVSFQWYPTGLVRGLTLRGNFLPHVDRYPIPSEGVPGFDRLARMVYEFDAADIGGSYMYPAMARSFREAGMQWATQFAYDPLALAHANTEYPTHYVNLVYAPQKAISLMIAAEAFRTLPRGASYGRYPQSTRFGPFRVSYEEDLSEMATDARFYHSNNTSTAPPNPGALRHVAGVGSSPVVRYDGTGAYFLDRLADGLWRLEVYPDAVWVADPFGDTGLRHPVSRLLWRDRAMDVDLPDLGAGFRVQPVNDGNDHTATAQDGAFPIRPGAYLLVRPGAEVPADVASRVVGQVKVNEFYAPPEQPAPTQVVHTPPPGASAGQPLEIAAAVVSARPAERVLLFWRRAGWSGFATEEMTPAGGYQYRARVPADRVAGGRFEYYITVEEGGRATTFPGAAEGRPDQWDFVGAPAWALLVAPPGAPLSLFRATRDGDRLMYPHQEQFLRYATDFVPGGGADELALRLRIERLDRPPHQVALRAYCGDRVSVRREELGRFDALAVRLRAVEPSTRRVEVALVQADGASFGASIPVAAGWQTVEVPLADLRPVPTVLLPRAYPFFLPFTFTPATAPSALRLDRVEAVQLSVGGADAPRDAAQGIEVEQVVLIQRQQP